MESGTEPRLEDTLGPGPAQSREPRRFDRKIAIVALIGLVSVTGALFTWRATVLNEQATDADRQSIAETVQRQQVLTEVETTVDAEAQAFAQYREELVLATRLDVQADELRAGGREVEARLVADAAADNREAAEDLLRLTGLDPYVEGTVGTGEVTFAEERRRADLDRQLSSQYQVDADVTAARADGLRDRAQGLVSLTIPLAFAVFLLTLAQLLRSTRAARPAIAGVGVVVWLATIAWAVVG